MKGNRKASRFLGWGLGERPAESALESAGDSGRRGTGRFVLPGDRGGGCDVPGVGGRAALAAEIPEGWES